MPRPQPLQTNLSRTVTEIKFYALLTPHFLPPPNIAYGGKVKHNKRGKGYVARIQYL